MCNGRPLLGRSSLMIKDNSSARVVGVKTAVNFVHGRVLISVDKDQCPVTSPETTIGIVCKTASVYVENSTTFAAAWSLNLETTTAATLDAASKTGASSVV
ncbi:hypothetical protein TNCV_729531 [Trichonephila clavipes]|nr:hypothetical protein TNCV_729531 [Trichonephila clavipes]